MEINQEDEDLTPEQVLEQKMSKLQTRISKLEFLTRDANSRLDSFDAKLKSLSAQRREYIEERLDDEVHTVLKDLSSVATQRIEESATELLTTNKYLRVIVAKMTGILDKHMKAMEHGIQLHVERIRTELDLGKLGLDPTLPDRVCESVVGGGVRRLAHRLDVKTWMEFQQFSELDLRQYRGVGSVTIHNLKEALSSRGLKLRKE